MKNAGHLGVPADRLRIYYARAMDGIEPLAIVADERSTVEALQVRGISIVNSYTVEESGLEDAAEVAEANLALLQQSHLLLANLSLQGYTYVGAVFEIVQAVEAGLPVVVYVGNTGFENRYYIHAYADFICSSLDEAAEYVYRCFSSEGTSRQIRETKDYYSSVADEYEDKVVNPYAEIPCERGEYLRERRQLKTRLRHYCRAKRVLELGCGTGEWTQAIAEVASSIVCVEASARMISETKRRLEHAAATISFLNEDFLDDTLPVEPCDVIVSYFAVSFLSPAAQRRLLLNMKKWLVSGGLILFAESRQIAPSPSLGHGDRRIQKRISHGNEFLIFKQRFTETQMKKLFLGEGFTIRDLGANGKWFVFGVACS